MSREAKREPLPALAAERDRAKRELTCCEHRLKILAKQEKELTRKERTHRLCTRGGMVEHFLEKPELLTDDQVMKILKEAFRRPEVKALLRQELENAEISDEAGAP